MLRLTSTPLLSPSPEKEAFKKRQKLQQDNGEETDENEVEEVMGFVLILRGVFGCGVLSSPHVGEGPSSAWPCKQAGGVMEPRTPCQSSGEPDAPQSALLWSEEPTSFWA